METWYNNKYGIRLNRKFKVVTTDAKHDYPIAPNRLDQHFEAQQANRTWLADITRYSILDNR